MAHPKIEEFINYAPGKYFNPDNAFGFQCKDLADAYAQSIFGVPWPDSMGAANAAQAFDRAPDAFWDKLRERPGQAGWVPLRGDIIVWGGDSINRFGHIALVVSADDNGVNVIQQDGYIQSAAFSGRLGYSQPGTGMVVGWLRPKPSKLPAVSAPVSAPTNGVPSRIITADVAAVMKGPNPHSGISPAYPDGLRKGARIGVVGYVQGADPIPNDGVQDDAWFKTISGLYVWANAAGNDLTGLKRL